MRTRELISLESIEDNPWQPRQNARDGEAFKQLVASIRQEGLMQTPMVRPGNRTGHYQLVFGHRRVEACRVLAAEGTAVNGWPVGQIEAEVADLTDERMAVMALTENDRRSEVPALEMTRAYRRVIDETSLTVKELAHRLGVKRPTLQNRLGVLNLPQVVLDRIDSGELSMSVAREFLPLVCDAGAHEEVMEAVVQSCENRGVWTRFFVRSIIHRECLREHDWGSLESQCRETYRDRPEFDVAAFVEECKGRLHRLPDHTDSQRDVSGSALFTCDVAEWDEWQKAAADAKAEVARAQLAAAASNDDIAGKEPRHQVYLRSALAEDPVWQGIAALRSEPGPDLPQNDRERAALGTRGEFVEWTTLPFWKKLTPANVRTPFDWPRAQGEHGDGVPAWFPDLEECLSCTIGAKWTRHGYPSETIPICANRQHYLEKLKAGEKEYRERLQRAREAEDAAAQEEMEGLLEGLKATAPETPQALLRAMVAANPVLEWRHPLGVYHKRFSDEPQMVERIRMILGMEPAPYDVYKVGNKKGSTIDPAKLEGLSQDDVEHLLAALTVHRLRQRWTATPQELAESSSGTGAGKFDELLAHLALVNLEGHPKGLPIADLYVCWDCNDHHIPMEPGEEPHEYHIPLGKYEECNTPLEWSGQLMGYDPDTGRISRTWDEKPRSPAPEGQATIPEDAYEVAGA